MVYHSFGKGEDEGDKRYEGSDDRDRQRPTLMLRNCEEAALARVLPDASPVSVHTTEYHYREAEDSKKDERQSHARRVEPTFVASGSRPVQSDETLVASAVTYLGGTGRPPFPSETRRWTAIEPGHVLSRRRD